MIEMNSEVILKKENNNNNSSILDTFRHHEGALKKYISRFLLPSHEIEDICQETFLRSFESNIKNEIERPKSFMYRVAKNLIMSKYRRSSYKLTDYIDDVTEEAIPINTADIESDIDAQRKLGIFCESIASLPEQSRKVLMLRKVYGYSIKEISSRLNMPTSTINYNIAKAMICCDNAIERYEENGLANEEVEVSDNSTWSQKLKGNIK
ncbi:RNA polymerase sigma factor [Colwellia piezophila]|uniref:RNA polymerase sigma factor n=1 Tax=Colwellia piezophila TaxID=211668 RepID=UPI000364CC76|nr:sigma-70 family RNA polymerase sigma factor [Colwellia piezophila]